MYVKAGILVFLATLALISGCVSSADKSVYTGDECNYGPPNKKLYTGFQTPYGAMVLVRDKQRAMKLLEVDRFIQIEKEQATEISDFTFDNYKYIYLAKVCIGHYNLNSNGSVKQETRNELKFYADGNMLAYSSMRLGSFAPTEPLPIIIYTPDKIEEFYYGTGSVK